MTTVIASFSLFNEQRRLKVNYPSDVAAGLELGRQVAQKVIAHAQADGSDAEWDGQ